MVNSIAHEDYNDHHPEDSFWLYHNKGMLRY